MKKKFLNKFTIIDIIIIICIIGAIGFAVYHMTIDTDNGTSVSFDTSTANKLVETYLNFYKDGNIITSQVTGTNASSGENITLNGTVVWVGDTLNGVEVIINSNGKDYVAGLYRSTPAADIYIDQISLETSGEKYQNVKEITISPREITKISDLYSKIPKNIKYELSTQVATLKIDSPTCQKLLNKLNDIKRPTLTPSNDQLNSLKIFKSDEITLKEASTILGPINGQTNNIIIRVYNCTDNDLNIIKNNYEVININTIS